MRAFYCALLCAACAVAGLGQVTKSGPGYLMRMKWVKGDAYAYTITLSGAGMKEPMQVGQFAVKVLNVSGGVANVNYTGSMMMQQNLNVTAKMDSRGAVDTDTNLRSLGGPRLPEKAVKVGEKWTVTQDQTSQGMKMTVTSTYTFKGLEKVGKVSCALLDVATTTTGVATTSTGKLYLEAANGQLLKMEMATAIGSGKQQMKTTTVIARK